MSTKQVRVLADAIAREERYASMSASEAGKRVYLERAAKLRAQLEAMKESPRGR